jgi:hypothetical protein
MAVNYVPAEYCMSTSKAAAAKQTLRACVNATLPFCAGTGMSTLKVDVAMQRKGRYGLV